VSINLLRTIGRQRRIVATKNSISPNAGLAATLVTVPETPGTEIMPATYARSFLANDR
jgi:hypothetical protein